MPNSVFSHSKVSSPGTTTMQTVTGGFPPKVEQISSNYESEMKRSFIKTFKALELPSRAYELALQYYDVALDLDGVGVNERDSIEFEDSLKLSDKIEAKLAKVLPGGHEHELMNSIDLFVYHYQPPAPRLVCIETNPGPPPKGLAADLGGLAALIGSIAATKKKSSGAKKKKKEIVVLEKTRKKKTQQKSSSSSSSGMNVLAKTMKGVFAPANTSVQTSNATKHTPFSVSGRCQMANVCTDGSGVNVLRNSAGTLSLSNIVDIDPTGSSNVPYNFAAFPPNIRGITTAFSRYKFKKMKITYVPFVGSATSGNLTLAVYPEPTTSGSVVIPTGQVTSAVCSSSTPIWATMEMDLLQTGGLRSEWLFVDVTPTANESQLRQETAGSFAISIQGTTTVSQDFGGLWLDFTIEYEGLSSSSGFVAPPPFQQTSSSSSIPLGSDTPRPLQVEEHALPHVPDLSESVYLPSSLLNKLGLQKV